MVVARPLRALASTPPTDSGPSTGSRVRARTVDRNPSGPLSEHALLLLRLIVQTTVHGVDGSVKRYWVPKNHPQYVGCLAFEFHKSDIPILRSLCKQRLIAPAESETPHAYASTRSGEDLANREDL